MHNWRSLAFYALHATSQSPFLLLKIKLSLSSWQWQWLVTLYKLDGYEKGGTRCMAFHENALCSVIGPSQRVPALPEKAPSLGLFRCHPDICLPNSCVAQGLGFIGPPPHSSLHPCICSPFPHASDYPVYIHRAVMCLKEEIRTVICHPFRLK